MPNLQIITVPNPLLKEKSEDVKEFNQNLKNTIRNMYDTLYSSGNGIGLAAPQVGIMKRIVVIDIKEKDKSNPITFINPKIVKKSKETFVNEEGCLSIPDFFANVERYKEVEVQWLNENGDLKSANYNGLMSICIQHEIDHLNGVLFIDHISKIKRKMAVEKVLKQKKKKTNKCRKSKILVLGFLGHQYLLLNHYQNYTKIRLI